MQRMILKKAAAQIRAARKAALKNGEEWTNPTRNLDKEINYDGYQEMMDERKERGDDLRTARKKISAEARKSRSTKPWITWNFNDGELVKIKGSAYKKYKALMDSMGIFAGAVGVIVENDDSSIHESGKLLRVMGPMGFQQWSAAWVIFCDE